jgi:hypothetical protein
MAGVSGSWTCLKKSRVNVFLYNNAGLDMYAGTHAFNKHVRGRVDY